MLLPALYFGSLCCGSNTQIAPDQGELEPSTPIITCGAGALALDFTQGNPRQRSEYCARIREALLFVAHPWLDQAPFPGTFNWLAQCAQRIRAHQSQFHLRGAVDTDAFSLHRGIVESCQGRGRSGILDIKSCKQDLVAHPLRASELRALDAPEQFVGACPVTAVHEQCRSIQAQLEGGGGIASRSKSEQTVHLVYRSHG